SISLFTFLYLTLPLYWVCGIWQQTTSIDVKAIRSSEVQRFLEAFRKQALTKKSPDDDHTRLALFEKLGDLAITSDNQIKLLIDGDQTFSEILQAIGLAKKHILFEFFIVSDDEFGRTVKEALIERS